MKSDELSNVANALDELSRQLKLSSHVREGEHAELIGVLKSIDQSISKLGERLEGIVTSSSGN